MMKLLFFSLLVLIPKVTGTCPSKDITVSYIESSGTRDDCIIKGPDLANDGASVSTPCHGIACSCKKGTRNCCYKTKCFDLKSYCVNVEVFRGEKIYCATEEEMLMDEDIPVRRIPGRK